MRRGAAFGSAATLLLSVVFVPFRHRTLVATTEGGFAFTETRIWAPLWAQPAVPSGVAEYPFRWLLGVWVALGLAAALLVFLGRRRRRGVLS